jgi:hypothetical protein
VILNAADLSDVTTACYYRPDGLVAQGLQTFYNGTTKALYLHHSDQGVFTPASRHEELPLLHGKVSDNSHALQCRGKNTKLFTIVKHH